MISHMTQRRGLIPLAVVGIVAAVVVIAISSMSSGTSAAGIIRGGATYEVSITNITKGQILSPAVVATHRERLTPIFEPGSPASPELAGVAEDAMLDPFIKMLEDDPNVSSVVTLTGAAGPIMPGETATVEIKARNPLEKLSLASMLVTTNDTFIGLSGHDLPVLKRSATYLSPGYDAGTEFNNEDCAYIPGPPCNNGGVRDTAGAEGYVYIGNGVHGIADLVPADHDWNNPVAVIKVTRVRN